MDAAYACAKDIRFPVLIKAAMGGRGPRIVRTEAEFKPAYERASNEVLQAFGDGRMKFKTWRHVQQHRAPVREGLLGAEEAPEDHQSARKVKEMKRKITCVR